MERERVRHAYVPTLGKQKQESYGKGAKGTKIEMLNVSRARRMRGWPLPSQLGGLGSDVSFQQVQARLWNFTLCIENRHQRQAYQKQFSKLIWQKCNKFAYYRNDVIRTEKRENSAECRRLACTDSNPGSLDEITSVSTVALDCVKMRFCYETQIS